MALLLKPEVGSKAWLGKSSVPCRFQPSTSTAARKAIVSAAAAGGKPNYKLDQPNRLWELGETWFPGADAPSYLDASLPGDRGFDPLRLAENPKLLPWMVEGELYNGRWAMMGVVGMLFVELIGRGPWSTAPFRADYYLPYTTVVVIAHIIYITIEYYRWKGFNEEGQTGILGIIPFDPLGLTNDRTRQSEVRNGRLAMLACLGFWSQAAVTQKGPLQNLQDHLADPGHNNICTSPVGKEVMFFAIALGIIPYYLEARKDFGKDSIQEEPFRPFPFLSPDDY